MTGPDALAAIRHSAQGDETLENNADADHADNKK